jgi:hypothetical protein
LFELSLRGPENVPTVGGAKPKKEDNRQHYQDGIGCGSDNRFHRQEGYNREAVTGEK